MVLKSNGVSDQFIINDLLKGCKPQSVFRAFLKCSQDEHSLGAHICLRLKFHKIAQKIVGGSASLFIELDLQSCIKELKSLIYLGLWHC